MTIKPADDMVKNWLEIECQMKQLLSKSDPSSISKISKKAMVDKNSITREKFADLVMSMLLFGSQAVDWVKKQNDPKDSLRAHLKELLPQAIKEAVTSYDLKELIPAVVKDAIPVAPLRALVNIMVINGLNADDQIVK